MSTPGYLWVTSEPGANVTKEEFTDWYDNEHVPLRMGAISEFLTGARYESADGRKPGYLAAYDIQDVSLFQDPKYTKLRANRSPREADLVKRLETLDRRMAKRLSQTSEPPKADETAPFVLTIESEEEPKEIEAFKSVSGWRRSHVHNVFDVLVTGHGKEPISKGPAYLSVHEFDSEEYVDSAALKEATQNAVETRRWKLYRAWPNTAS